MLGAIHAERRNAQTRTKTSREYGNGKDEVPNLAYGVALRHTNCFIQIAN